MTLRATALGLVVRLAQWLWLAAGLCFGLTWDALCLRSNPLSRARRVRMTFQRAGGTLVKLGQQLSLRADLLPYQVCDELRQLLDRAEPIPWEVARAKVSAQVGKLEDAFASFDPEPIGSASVACVYRAVRHDGRAVAVKVLRPRAREVFGADLTLLHLCLVPAEWLMLLRSGQAANLVQQLRTMFEEELDLRSEARYQELFRQAVRKTRVRYLSAPAIHFDLSGADVMVSDFAEGLACDRVLAAVEEGDTAVLEQLASQQIDPRTVAKRLLKGWNWQVFQFPIFHGDPHPANILVQPGGHLVLVDFGACSYFSDRGRALLRNVQLHMLAGDFRAMASAAMGLLEPYPPIDVDRFGEELELLYARYMHAAQSDHAEWWERATSKIWLDFIQLARKYMIPVSLDTLRLFRATFLLDTVVFRLDPDLKLAGVYRAYLRQEDRWLRRKYLRHGLIDRSGQPLISEQRLQSGVALFDKIGER
ncbi:MAG: AarF/ABC1/UbiB kinase family protein, partial [Deltaproteobacteria bacterium]|nr:AarF/ABC1/UbiB kinase family protein [Deltaproteobacteria bacterium]